MEAGIEFLPCVDSLMYLKAVSPGEILATLNALMRLLPTVDPLVCPKTANTGVRLVTMGADLGVLHPWVWFVGY